MALSFVAEFKLFSAALIWVLALVGGFGPLLLRAHQRTDHTTSHSDGSGSKRVVLLTSVLNMFAGGIFLSGACLHLLPDAQENKALAQWLCESEDGCFKWANFFFGCGFLLVLLLEVFAHAVQHTFGEAKNSRVQVGGDRADTLVHELTPLVGAPELDDNEQQMRHDHYRHHESCSSVETDGSSSPQARSYSEDIKSSAATASEHGHAHHDHDIESGAHSHKQWCDDPSAVMYGTAVVTLHGKQHHGTEHATSASCAGPNVDEHCAGMEVTHAHIHGMMDAKPMLAFVVFIALSFHSIMEGMGIGASSHAAWDILVAILAHKSLAAFALTQELVHHRVALRRVLASIAVFSLMTPVGILLGALLVDTSTETVSSGVCSALAGGTFLFVAAMEVIPQELQRREHLMPKCAALLAGYTAMGVLSIWA